MLSVSVVSKTQKYIEQALISYPGILLIEHHLSIIQTKPSGCVVVLHTNDIEEKKKFARITISS